MGDGPASHTDWIVQVTQAYFDRDVEDMADMLVAMEPPNMLDGTPATQNYRVKVKARELDGFLKFFTDGNCSRHCNTCRYCGNWAEKAAEVIGDRPAYAARMDDIKERLMIGDFRTGRPAARRG